MSGDGGDGVPARVREARRRLEAAMEDAPSNQRKPRRPGERVDKYFGSKLPPVCARLGCYRTDDGKRFFCVVPSCHKDRKRETKHTRRGRRTPARAGEAATTRLFFRCPRCAGSDVEVRHFGPRYACRACSYVWDP